MCACLLLCAYAANPGASGRLDHRRVRRPSRRPGLRAGDRRKSAVYSLLERLRHVCLLVFVVALCWCRRIRGTFSAAASAPSLTSAVTENAGHGEGRDRYARARAEGLHQCSHEGPSCLHALLALFSFSVGMLVVGSI